MLDFNVCLRQILSDDTEGHEDHAAEEEHEGEEGRIARYVIPDTEHDRMDEVIDQVAERQAGDEESYECGDAERRGGEGDDTFDGIEEKRPEGPFRLAGNTLDIFEFQPFCTETDPGEDTFAEALTLGKGQDRIDDRAGHDAEVSGTIDDLDICELVDQTIETAGEETADRRFAFSGDAAGSDDVTLAGFEGLKHLRKKRRRILHISIQKTDPLAFGGGKAGIHGGFFAEISGKRDVADARVPGGHIL